VVGRVVCVQTEKDRETAQLILDALIKWSIECTQLNQTAHIVFVADNAFTTDILSRRNVQTDTETEATRVRSPPL
jgi:hypothetical protein